MLAQRMVAKIYCTVSTSEKKSLLMSKHGIPEDHMFSSCYTTFATSLLHAMKSGGVDVVLKLTV